MPIDKQTALDHLDSVIADFENLGAPDPYDEEYDGTEPNTMTFARLLSALSRLAPPGSAYDPATFDDPYLNNPSYHGCSVLAGYAKGLRADYAGDCLTTFRELVNADLFSDFLAMAEHLLQSEDQLKQPAAVLAGGVLEEHIRKLCGKHGVAVTVTGSNSKVKPKSVDTMNADLRKGGIYGSNEQKLVTAWYGIRTSAAHARHNQYDPGTVQNMIDGLRNFVSRFPA